MQECNSVIKEFTRQLITWYKDPIHGYHLFSLPKLLNIDTDSEKNKKYWKLSFNRTVRKDKNEIVASHEL